MQFVSVEEEFALKCTPPTLLTSPIAEFPLMAQLFSVGEELLSQSTPPTTTPPKSAPPVAEFSEIVQLVNVGEELPPLHNTPPTT